MTRTPILTEVPSASPMNTLSALGAGVAGVGLGALIASPLAPIAWPIMIGGLAIHLFGMVGRHRSQIQAGKPPTRWETVAYWLCWIAIGVVAVILLMILLA